MSPGYGSRPAPGPTHQGRRRAGARRPAPPSSVAPPPASPRRPCPRCSTTPAGSPSPPARRVLETAARLGWSPSASASALRRARTRTLAMVVRRPTDVLGTDLHFSELITGLESELSPRGYGLLLHLAGDVARGDRAVRTARRRGPGRRGRTDRAPGRRPAPAAARHGSGCPRSCWARPGEQCPPGSRRSVRGRSAICWTWDTGASPM